MPLSFFPLLLVACGPDPLPVVTSPPEPVPNCVPEGEVCDQIDNDCDGQIDEFAEDGVIRYFDGDGDGFGTGLPVTDCGFIDLGPAYVLLDGDCNDRDDEVFPGAEELCDGIDQDCDTVIDDGVPTQTYFLDGDDDGFGGEVALEACRRPDGYVVLDGDCNDDDETINPVQPEICDDLDQDCDGEVDEDLPTEPYYLDADGDGYGAPGTSIEACQQPTGRVPDASDCDDASNSVFPGAMEFCDDIDQDCDGAIDEDLEVLTFYIDGDGDGFGAVPIEDCQLPAGAVLEGGDCADDDASISPGVVDVCDGLDNDCSGSADDGGSSSIGTTAYSALQAAFAAATAGDTIALCPGNHTLTGAITQPVTLEGFDWASLTPSALRVEAGGNLTLRHLSSAGQPTEPFVVVDGGALTLDHVGTEGWGTLIEGENAQVTLTDTTIDNSQVAAHLTGQSHLEAVRTAIRNAGASRVLLLESSVTDSPSLRFEEVDFSDNSTSFGIVVLDGSQGLFPIIAEMVDTSWHGNDSGFGSALWALNAVISGSNNELFQNDSLDSGGAVRLEDNSVLDGFTMESNSSAFGGGLYVSDSEVHNTIVQNNSSFSGGGLYLRNATLVNVTAEGNGAVGDGGGIYVEANTTADMDVSILGNHAAGDGGGLFIGQDATVTLGGLVHGNSADGVGAGARCAFCLLDSSADWGTPGTPEDNGPPDVSAGSFIYNYDQAPFVLDFLVP